MGGVSRVSPTHPLPRGGATHGTNAQKPKITPKAKDLLSIPTEVGAAPIFIGAQDRR